MKNISIDEFKQGGKRYVRIPLGKDESAVTDASTWNEVRELGLWSSWRLGAGGHVVASHPAFPNGYTLVSRVITSNLKVKLPAVGSRSLRNLSAS